MKKNNPDPPASLSRTALPLDKPFFTLEYKEGVFLRRLPGGVKDLGGGFFREGKTLWKLPGADGQNPEAVSGADAALAHALISGRALLGLLNRGKHPLIKDGPRIAENGERLMELVFSPPRSRSLRVELRVSQAGAPQWLPLEGLPHHRFYNNYIYEIIGDETIEKLLSEYGDTESGEAADSGQRFLVLKGEDIPRFTDNHGRLIYRFGDEKLKKTLAGDEVFLKKEELSLVLSIEPVFYRGLGTALAKPLVKYKNRRYDAEEVSDLMDREYIQLDSKWARRADLLGMGLLPLSYYAGGRPIEKLKCGPPEIFRRAASPWGFPVACEWNEAEWMEHGTSETVFLKHLEFLRTFGLSGGVIQNSHKDQAKNTALWLARAASRMENGKILVLAEKSYYELYLSAQLPRLKAIMPPVSFPGELSGKGIEIRYYEDLGETGPPVSCDILLLIEPEAAVLTLKRITAAIILGIFGEIKPAMIKLLGIGGKTAQYAKYLVRNVKAPLPLPEKAEIHIPARGALYSFSEKTRFRQLPAADLLDEINLFKDSGTEAAFTPLVRERLPFFGQLSREERRCFLWWRAAFRAYAKGDKTIHPPRLKTSEGYILIYSRELILAMGGENPECYFYELLELWQYYRETYPDLDKCLPRWIFDFAVLYNMEEAGLPVLLSRVQGGLHDILGDLRIHEMFISNNNSICFSDIKPLLLDIKQEGIPLPETEIAAALNAADRYLRENFHIRFLEFFYPQAQTAEKREAFAGLSGAGKSSYTASWVSFSRHGPLKNFLEAFVLHIARQLGLKTGVRGRLPLEEPWKSIADAGIGRKISPPVPGRRPVEKELLEKLRKESGEVMELLRIEDHGREEAQPPVTENRAEKQQPSSFSSFFSGLSETEKESLRLIFEKKYAEFGKFAKDRGLMPDLVIDGINERFQEQFRDLLIDTMDEDPRIQAEYIKEAAWIFQKG
jgi:hypothetical protein